VRLRLRAPRNSWQDLTVSDFRATLDLTNLGPGQHDVAVQVKSLDPQVGILDVQRPQLRVTLDTLSAKEVPVEVEIMDTSAFGYDAQPAVYRPVTVTVSGPASQVQQVVRARTEIFLRGAKNQVERMEEVTPVNTQGEAVTRVTTEPAQVQVVVPVEQWPGRKEVAVRVKLQGGPADGYRLSSVKVDPSTVVLQGNTEVLAGVPGYVETEPLTLDGATADVRLRLALLLPDGVTSFDGDTVVATAGITPIEGGVTISQPLVQRGLAPG
jgi:YbbR domain-containing protein